VEKIGNLLQEKSFPKEEPKSAVSFFPEIEGK
jgi:hypothetical protein